MKANVRESPQHDWRLPSLALLAVIAGWYVLVLRLNLWAYLAVPARPEAFLDLRTVLGWFENWRAGVAPGGTLASLPEGGQWVEPFNYPVAWLAFAFLPLRVADAGWLGVALAGGALIAVVDLLRPTSQTEAVYGLLILASPAFAFALERANPDLVVFLLVWAAWRGMNTSHRAGLWLACAAAAVATLLKLYPVAIFPVLWLHAPPSRRRGITLIATLTVAASAIEWTLIEAPLPNPMGRYVFGARSLFDYLGVPASGLIAAVAVVGVLGLSIAAFRWTGAVSMASDRAVRSAYLLGSAVLLFCFLAANSFDYRLVFAVMIVPFLLSTQRDPGVSDHARLVSRFGLVALLVVMWAEFIDLGTRLAILRFGGSAELALRVQPPIHLAEHAVSWLFVAGMAAIAGRVTLAYTQPPREPFA